MRHDFLDRYSRLDSAVHRLSTATKCFVALALIGLSVAFKVEVWWIFLAIGLGLTATVIASRIPVRFVLTRLLMLEPFVLGIAAMALLQEGGFTIFLNIVVKSTLCLVTLIVLTNTTPFSDILSLLRKAGIPPLLITVLALTYRYLFVLIDEAERISRARKSRTFVPKRARSWMSLSSLIGQLFVRSTERAERIYAAMASRGWK